MTVKMVMLNGVEMAEEWPEQIAQAQKQVMYCINGMKYPRVRYGDEGDDWGAEKRPCHDCCVLKGQLHVPGVGSPGTELEFAL